MADDTTLHVGIEADASDAVRDMHAAADAVAGLGDSFREVATIAASVARSLNKVEQGVTGTGRASKQAASDGQQNVRSLSAQAEAARELAQEAKAAATSVRNLGGLSTAGTGSTRVGSSLGAGGRVGPGERASIDATNYARQQAAKIAKAQQDAIMEVVKANVAETRAWSEKNRVVSQAAQVTGTYAGSAREVAERMQAAGFSATGAAGNIDQFRESLFTARFALNDISNGASIAGAALLAFSAVSINAAGTYEDAMAGVRRTTGATTSQVEMIREQFVDLAQTIPGGFDNLAQIGELAGQLNIPTERLASFTETVAQFTSSTDVAVQASAEAFGRLDTLLPDVQGNYEALGSAILNTGVNSVATESSIVSTTTQIAAAGAQAGFAADEVIGLAASYASLGIAPEAARGSTIRIFSEIRQAIAGGGAELETFASLASMSADEFKAAWLEGDTAGTFLQFLQGLQKEGSNAETTLRELGITGVRDINALLRLSQNAEVVGETFSYAADGFEQATQLGTAFGVTSETLNSRLQLLGQSFQALIATLGESGSGPLKEFVNLLIDVIKTVTELSKSPVAQWAAMVTGLFTILAGGVLIVTSLAARFGALQIALRTTRMELATMSAAANAGTLSLNRLGVAGLTAGKWLTNLSNILKLGLWGGAITIGISAIVGLITAIGDASKSSADKAKEAWGDLSDVTSALQKDTEIYAETGERLGTVEGKLTTVTKTTAGWVDIVNDATGAQTQLAGETDVTSESVERQTYAYGENTKALIANKLANEESIKTAAQRLDNLEAMGFDTSTAQGAITAAVNGDITEARRLLEVFRAEYDAFSWDEFGQFADSANAGQVINEGTEAFYKLSDAVTLVDGALQEGAESGRAMELVQSALGESSHIAADGSIVLGEALEESGDKADSFAQRVRDAADASFSIDNALSGSINAADTLFAGLEKNGYMFDALSVGGSANMKNLQDTLVATIIAAEAAGVNAVDAAAVVFAELQKQGVDTLNLIAGMAPALNAMLGGGAANSIKAAVTGQRQLGAAAQTLGGAFSQVAQKARSAASGTRSAGNAAREAAKEVRTLKDYASDLSKVWDRAFEIRYSGEQGLDKITTSWISMRDAIDDANKEIAEAQRRMQELTTDNNSLMYFQQVAVDYGDALRAAEIADELAKNNAELAEENDKVTAAQNKLNKGLNGNTKSAIDNRAQLLGLVGEYQDYLGALAASGMSQADLQATAARLRSEFVNQAVQMGFSRNEVERYAVAFDDMTFAINNVPRNITIQANANPAMTALKELEAQAKRTASAVGGVGGGLGGSSAELAAAANRMRYQVLYLEASANSAIYSARAVVSSLAGDPWGALANRLSATAYAVSALSYRRAGGFKSGGYTGNVGTSDVAGVVHGKEYVINAENTQRLGIPFLNALNRGMTPSSPATSGTMVVELSSRDRALLAAAGNVTLSIDGKVIANSSNAANFVAAQRGSN